jgi:AraC family transcriptional regulator
MKFMVLVKATKSSEAGAMPSQELLAAMGKFNEELVNAGIMLAGDGLHPSSKGARVRFSGKDRLVIDGPFAETKELVAGYWIWQTQSLAEAIEWVKRCPNPMPEESEIEIRQIFTAEDFGEIMTPEIRELEAATRARSLGLSAPTFRDRDGMLIAGLNESYDQETRSRIPQQWMRIGPHLGNISGQVGTDAYGVCHAAGKDCRFQYLTGVAVSSADRLPAGFTTIKLEPHRYAVFSHTGHVSALPATIDVIWSKWAPDCSLAIDHAAPCFERYTGEFNPTTGLGGMEIWMPLAS